MFKPAFGYDDSLDAFGIHGVGGILGAIATGLFSSAAINSAGADGLFFGDAALLGKQFMAVGAAFAYSFVLTFVILKAIDLVMGIRVTGDEEAMGLDLSQHSESGYTM